jgi:dTDP-4-dehydrorhamnose reductase
MERTRILLTGGKGLLGRALQVVLGDHDLIVSDLEEMDITDTSAVDAFFRESRPEMVVHCAAYTDVEGSAKNPNLAYVINGAGTLNVAHACRKYGSEMVHISTNEVFSGQRTTGYEEWMPLDPINPYGRSKADAELHVQRTLTNFYIVRTAWLYGPGARNFIQAIIDRARKIGALDVVADEIGNPTYSLDLARGIRRLIATGQYGIYHLVNEGACSRWGFANKIIELIGIADVRNTPILSIDYSRASRPPLFGQLRNVSGTAVGVTLRPWTEALADYIYSYEIT